MLCQHGGGVILRRCNQGLPSPDWLALSMWHIWSKMWGSCVAACVEVGGQPMGSVLSSHLSVGPGDQILGVCAILCGAILASPEGWV